MASWTERIPADELAARAAEARPGRALATAFAAIGVALGWALGRGLRCLGWLAGRSWLILAYFAETVVFGFREGAGLSQPVAKAPRETVPPA